MKIYYYEGEPNVSHKYSNIYIYIFRDTLSIDIFLLPLCDFTLRKLFYE